MLAQLKEQMCGIDVLTQSFLRPCDNGPDTWTLLIGYQRNDPRTPALDLRMGSSHMLPNLTSSTLLCMLTCLPRLGGTEFVQGIHPALIEVGIVYFRPLRQNIQVNQALSSDIEENSDHGHL
jgi:hypothetical protein